jgi:excisionase family DNA binding protein
MKDSARDQLEPLAVTAKDAARMLGISERSLFELKATGKLPFVRVGCKINYAVEDLKAYLNKNRQVKQSA